MSQPPSYGSPPPTNPDTRTLPPGWISQYDPNYRAWFYVNTVAQPAQTTWVHPLGPPGSTPPPNQYGAPPGPPPPGPPPPGGPGYGYGSPPPQQQYGGYPSQQGYGGYGSPPPQGGYYNQSYNQQGYGPGPGGYGGHQPYPPQQVVYADQKPQKSGPGMGTMLAVGGAGLLGGALIGEAIADHQEEEEREAYMDGYQDGQDGDFDGGDW